MKKFLRLLSLVILFVGSAYGQLPISPGNLAEQLWTKYESIWQPLLQKDQAQLYIERGRFFKAVSQGAITENNAAAYFKELPNYLNYPNYQFTNTPPGPTTQGACNPSCSNIGFQNGTLSSWSAWYGIDGSTQAQIIINGLTGGACGSVTEAAGPNPNTNDDYHVVLIDSPGVDPVAGALIPLTPPLGGNCVMVGDGAMNGFGVARLEQTYIVDATNPILTIQYAVVLQNPGHTGYQQPWFKIELLDQNDNPIPGCAQYFVVAAKGLPGFTPVWHQYDTVYCKPWTTAFVPLDSYIGECVTLRFTSSDCAMGGHFGYAYVAATCSKLNLTASTPVFCTGQKSAIIKGPPGGATYQWATSNGCISGSSTQSTLKVTCAGTYSLVTTSTAGAQCLDSFAITIPPSASGPPPVACFKADTVCSGNPTHFNALCSNPNSGVTYYWDYYNSGFYDDSSGASPSKTFSAGGLYKPRLHVVDANGCSSDTVVTIAVDSSFTTTFPTFSDSVIDASVCGACDGGVYLTMYLPYNSNGTTFGTSYVITNTFSNFVDTVRAFTAKGYGTGSCDTSITFSPVVSGSNYKLGIRFKFTNCLCPGTHSFIVNTNPPTAPSKCNPGGITSDTIEFIVGNKTANITGNITTSMATCGSNNGSASVTGFGGTGPYIYSWSGGLGTGTSKSNLAAGTYSVTITDANGCVGFATAKIKSAGQLPAVVTPYYISCYGANDGCIKVKPTGGVGPYTYSWTGTASVTDSAGALAPGTYSVTVSDISGCSGTYSATIVQPAQLRDTLTSSLSLLNCVSKGSATFSASGGSLPYTYKWSDGTATRSNVNLTPGVTTITITDANGCTVKDSVTVTDVLLPTVNPVDTIICPYNFIQLQAGGGTTYAWKPGNNLTDSTVSNPMAYVVTPITYTVSVSKPGCTGNATVNINVYPIPPVPTITGSHDTLFCETDPSYVSYQWYFNNTLLPGATDTSWFASQSGNYNVAIVDTNGCNIAVGINYIISGNESISGDGDITVLPNPVKDELIIFGDVQGVLYVFNVLGEIIVHEKVATADRVVLNIKDLSSGIYFLQVEKPGGSFIRRFVKE